MSQFEDLPNLGRAAENIEAYQRALELDPDYDIAMLNLSGAGCETTKWRLHTFRV